MAYVAPIAPPRDLVPEAIGVSPEWQERCRKRMATIDRLTPELRALVHDIGWTTVNQFLMHGVKSARAIRHLVFAVHDGAWDDGQGSQLLARCERIGHDVAVAPEEWRAECLAAFDRGALRKPGQ